MFCFRSPRAISSSHRLSNIIARNLQPRSEQTPFVAAFANPTHPRRSFFRRADLVGGESPNVIKSPSATLIPNLTQAEIDALPYPPDALPGARNVDSPVSTSASSNQL